MILENEFKVIDIKKDNLSEKTKEIVERYQKIFGKNVLFNFCGVPDCFSNDDLY